MSKFEESQKIARPNINVGDTIVVDTIIRDGDKKRIQKFKGVVIAKKGKGIASTFTIRKISYGVGVEKILPLYSPNVGAIEIVKHGKITSSKLYYLRQRIGKAALFVKPGKELTEESNKLNEVEKPAEDKADVVEENPTEEVVEEKAAE